MTKNSQPAVLELAKIVIIEQIQENVKTKLLKLKVIYLTVRYHFNVFGVISIIEAFF